MQLAIALISCKWCTGIGKCYPGSSSSGRPERGPSELEVAT